jgi:hypothetical protein
MGSMIWRTITFVLVLTAVMTLVTWLTVAAHTFDGPHHRAVAGLCAWDLERFCGRAGPGDLVCLARHADRLSLPCYRALRVAAILDGCEPDYRRWCAGVPPGGGRLAACLRANADRLSGTCLRALRGPTNAAAGPRFDDDEEEVLRGQPCDEPRSPAK